MQFQRKQSISKFAVSGFNIVLFGTSKPKTTVISGVSVDKNRLIAQTLCDFDGMIDQSAPYPLFLKCRQHAYRTKAYHFFFRTIIGFDNTAGIDNIPDNPAIFFSDKIKFPNKILAFSEVMQKKMFAASRNIKVPKRFPRQFLNNSMIVLIFVFDDDVHI